MKRYWRDYVEHMLRTYTHNTESESDRLAPAERKNWSAVDAVYRMTPPIVCDMILNVYGREEEADQAVKRWASRHGVRETDVWSQVHQFIRKVAEERGLI